MTGILLHRLVLPQRKASLRHVFFGFLLSIFVFTGCAQKSNVRVIQDKSGFKLQVSDQDFFVKGMNWTYYPIGTNYEYSLWNQSDDFIKAALDYEMSMLQEIGVNAIRVYANIPPKWVTYIHDTYGIHSMINHTFGRYGLMIDNEWIASTDYSNEKARKQILLEVEEMVSAFKGTRGVLMYLLGNENNYGLFWEGAETENIPDANPDKNEQAIALYSLFNEGAKAIKKNGMDVPVAICNGDIKYLEIMKKECSEIDILGMNIYRGISFEGVFNQVKAEWEIPVLFTEFGADAFNTIDQEEDQMSQAIYLKNNLKEIYENAATLGKANNCIGAFTFQFSDGWWKLGQTKNLEVHDSAASWYNGGYKYDFKAGKNNINEEWFGICAKGPTDSLGQYQLYPRAAYYVIAEANLIDPTDTEISLSDIQIHFDKIDVKKAFTKAKRNEE